MKKIIEITKCSHCPHFNIIGIYCTKTKVSIDKIKSFKTIPDWCPLPSPKEYCEANFNIDE